MFAERLKSLRKEQNLTQQKIAEKLNISRGSYAQWEAQRTQPSSKSLETLANFFDVSTDYLLGNTDIKNQNQFDEDFLILRKGDTVPQGFTFPVSTK